MEQQHHLNLKSLKIRIRLQALKLLLQIKVLVQVLVETISLIFFQVQPSSQHSLPPSNNKPPSASWTKNSLNSSNNQIRCNNRIIFLEECRLTIISRLNPKHNKMLLALWTNSQHSSLSSKCHNNSNNNKQMHLVLWTSQLLSSSSSRRSHLTYLEAWTWVLRNLNSSNHLEAYSMD